MKNVTGPLLRTYTVLQKFGGISSVTVGQVGRIAGLPVNIVGRHLRALVCFGYAELVGRNKFRLKLNGAKDFVELIFGRPWK